MLIVLLEELGPVNHRFGLLYKNPQEMAEQLMTILVLFDFLSQSSYVLLTSLNSFPQLLCLLQAKPKGLPHLLIVLHR